MKDNNIYVGHHNDPNALVHAKYIKKVKTKSGKWRYIYDKKDLTTVHMKPTYNGTTGAFPQAPTGGLNHYVTSATVDSNGNIVNTSGLTSRKKPQIYNPNAPKSKGVKRRGKGLGTGPVGPDTDGKTHNAFNSLAYQQRKANAKKVTLLTALHRADKQQKKKAAEEAARKARPLTKKISDAAKDAYNMTGIKQKKLINKINKSDKFSAGLKKRKIDYQTKQYNKTLMGKAEKKLKSFKKKKKK